MKKKELEFECWHCFDEEKNKLLRFKNKHWNSVVLTDECGNNPYIDINVRCPKCNCYCHRSYDLNELLEMIFELQEEIKLLKK